MKYGVFFLSIFLLSGSVHALGIAVSPNIISLEPNAQRRILISNPNDVDIKVKLETDCNDTKISDDYLLIAGHSVSSTLVKSAAKTTGCDGSIIISVVDDSAKGIGINPAVTMPVRTVSNVESYPVYEVLPNYDSRPEPSKLTGTITTIAVVVVGLGVYYFKDYARSFFSSHK